LHFPSPYLLNHNYAGTAEQAFALYRIEASCCTVYCNFRILTSPPLCNSVNVLNSHFEALCVFDLFI
jgi:hypothetical protein